MGIVVIGNAFNGEFAVESLLQREGTLVESGPAVHIVIGVDPLAEQESRLLGLGSKSAVMRMSCGSLASTSLSRHKRINWALSMNRSWPILNEMFFSALLVMQVTFPLFSAIVCMMRWLS